MSSISLVKFDHRYLDLSWFWLNDPEIKLMTNTPDFTQVSQLAWFKSLPIKNNYLIWGITNNDRPIGVCGLKNITTFDCEYWGYIGDKQNWGKGFGSIVIKLMEEKGRQMELKSIWLKVSSLNERAIRLYQKNGFIIESSTSELLIMCKNL